jgi:hypothetical protein
MMDDITLEYLPGHGFFQGGEYIGHSSSKWRYGNSADAMGIALTDSSFLSSGVFGNYYKLNNIEVAGNDVIGDIVCISGIKSGNNCGVLEGRFFEGFWGRDEAKGIEGVWFDNLRVASYASTGGDSGGTIHNGSILKGIHKGSLDGRKYYSHVTHVQNRLGLTVVNWK